MAQRDPRPRVAGRSRRPTGLSAGESAPVEPATVGRPVEPMQPVEPGQPVQPVEPVQPDLLVVGRVGKPQGLRGEVTVEVRTDDPAARFADGAALLTDPPERGPLVVAGSRDQNGRLMVRFEGSEDRNAAEALRGTMLFVDAATIPPTGDPDEFHDFELVGLAAQLPDGTPVGQVSEVLHLPHGDVLAVRHGPPGTADLLVPFVAAMVPVVDVSGGRLVVDPPPGLLDLTAPGAAPDAPES